MSLRNRSSSVFVFCNIAHFCVEAILTNTNTNCWRRKMWQRWINKSTATLFLKCKQSVEIQTHTSDSWHLSACYRPTSVFFFFVWWVELASLPKITFDWMNLCKRPKNFDMNTLIYHEITEHVTQDIGLQFGTFYFFISVFKPAITHYFLATWGQRKQIMNSTFKYHHLLSWYGVLVSKQLFS